MSTEPKTRTNEEFITELLRLSIDFNSQIMSVATSELAGDTSGKNRSHQRNVVSNLQALGQQYQRRLDYHFDERDRELRGDAPVSGYNDKDTKSIRRTIAIIDEVMQKNPGKEYADASNLLELMLHAGDEKAEETKPANKKAEK